MSQGFEFLTLPRTNTKLDFNRLNERHKDEKEKTNMVRTYYSFFEIAAAIVVIASYLFPCISIGNP